MTYTSDPVNGFNAVVDRHGGAVAVAKPVAHAAIAPIGHAHPAVAGPVLRAAGPLVAGHPLGRAAIVG